MTAATVTTLTSDHLPAAAELLAARQRMLRTGRPELPASFEEPGTHLDSLAAALAEDGSHGVIVLAADGRPGAFLLGAHRTPEIWGRAAWSPITGSAVDPSLGAAGVELLRDCYAAWSQHFVDRGIFRHYVHAPSDDPLATEAWANTGFGRMQAHAVRPVIGLRADPPAGITIRAATPDDLEAIRPLMTLIPEQLLKSPAYAIQLPEGYAAHRAGWTDELAHPEGPLLVALEGERALAIAGFYEASNGPMAPDGAWELGVAMTLPEARGRGIMRALISAGLAEVAERGAVHCITDWRTASLAAARSWTALGWERTHHRLHRHVDERIAWAGRPITT
ncbi:MAG: GNAT family N-acetyltransferase [Chloroflexota bacterium]